MPLSTNERSGASLAIGCYLMWGLVPLFWKLLSHVQVEHILFHRILWSLFLSVLIGILSKRLKWSTFKMDFKQAGLSAALIGINWGVFIWAMTNNMVMQASLGYFINPFITILLGYFFHKERFNRGQQIAIGFSLSGVAILTVLTGSIPWAHLDIAGVAWTDKAQAYRHTGATGFGVRLMGELLRTW